MLRYAQAVVDGRTISYATDGSGPPLLLLHNPPFDHRVWLPTIPYLVGHARVILPDLPGFGRSPADTGDGSPESLIRTVAGLMTTLRIAPCAVAGVSLGGGIALGLAAAYPERVQALIGVGTVGMQWWPDTLLARLTRALRGVPGLPEVAMELAPRLIGAWLLRETLRDRQAAHEALGPLAANLSMRDARTTLMRILRRLDDWQLQTARLRGIGAPTLLVWGERDAWYGLPSAERLRLAISGATLRTISAAGHLVTLERPAEVGEAIRTFLAGVRASGGRSASPPGAPGRAMRP